MLRQRLQLLALGVDRLPGWVNRAALLGSWVACLLPKSLLTNSSVGGGDTGAPARRATAIETFSGKGQRLGSDSGSTTAVGGAQGDRSAIRERAVQAALARERAMQATGDD